MERLVLGKSGIEVSRLCFGTLTMGPLQKNLPLLEGVALLEAAFMRGMNFLDTAEYYKTYPYVREALRQKPDAVVATKSYAYDSKGADKSFKAAVEGIGREYIDLFLLHEQESALTLKGHREALEYYLKRKQQGLIGALGLSTHFVTCVAALKDYPEIDVIHPLINLTGIGIADGTRADMESALMGANEAGVGIYLMKPLGGGNLINRREEALSYMFSLPFAQSVAIGMQSLPEVEYACAFASGEPVDGLLAGLDGAGRKLFIDGWCAGCGKCVSRCKGGALSIEGKKARVDHSKCVLCGYCAPECPEFCIKVL